MILHNIKKNGLTEDVFNFHEISIEIALKQSSRQYDLFTNKNF